MFRDPDERPIKPSNHSPMFRDPDERPINSSHTLQVGLPDEASVGFQARKPMKAAHLKVPEESKSVGSSVGSKKMSAGPPTHVQLKAQRTNSTSGKPPSQSPHT
jgi:hypothetical protein